MGIGSKLVGRQALVKVGKRMKSREKDTRRPNSANKGVQPVRDSV